MTFHSILFRSEQDETPAPSGAPSFFVDLHLDQIVDAIIWGKDEYLLRPFFHAPLLDADAVRYRHEVMRDVEKSRVYDLIAAFAHGMGVVRESMRVAEKSSYPHERNRWILDAANRYCEDVRRLADGLGQMDVESRGLRALHGHLNGYVRTAEFANLASEAEALLSDLARFEYRIVIRSGSLNVRNGNGEGDLVAAVQTTFERFRQGATKSYLLDFPRRVQMNHVEAKVLEYVALLHADVFEDLARFAQAHAEFVDELVRRFDREIQFYVACVDYAALFAEADLSTCYPQVGDNKSVFVDEGFDLALARRLVASESPVVCNDFALDGPERIFVVSGPNQGGKTTFARTFGQMHYLAALGCRVAGRRAATMLFDQMFTHFEREEDASALRGKLEDDIIRIHEILEQATPRSVIILNELFASTTAHDASVLARRVMKQILTLDALCVCVTFIDELASLSEKTVSVVSLVDLENPDVRTFKLARRPADGLAYALSLAEKYGLTPDRLKRRLARPDQR